MTVEHPAKVDAAIYPAGESAYLPIVTKTLSDCKDSGEQQRGINRRDFAVPASLAGFRVEPVIKPATLLKRA
jgi:hypothetical protein